METAIAFAAGMLLTLIALALEDWTRLSEQKNATLPHEEKLGAAKMFFPTVSTSVGGSNRRASSLLSPSEPCLWPPRTRSDDSEHHVNSTAA